MLTRAVFLRLLGVIYLAAFASIASQIDGLVGSRGILPAARFMEAAGAAIPANRLLQLPTLCWFNASDAMLHFLSVGGVVLAVLLIVGVLPQLCLVLLWVFYLSIVNVGQDFLSFQWDALLLEAGFLAIFFAPMKPFLGVRNVAPPSRVVRYLFAWLLFRLMFLSGVVKITGGDPNWANLTAMSFHYETQPLPTWTSWFAHHEPMWLHRGETVATFAIELLVPFLYFLPRRLRTFGCVLTMLLQLSILATGNFGFFNLLAIVLCVPLLDDAAWPKRLRKRFELSDDAARPRPAWRGFVLAPLAGAIVIASTVQGVRRAHFEADWLRPAVPLARLAGNLRVTSAYGLFEVMTTERPEIIIEGSDDDGATWKPYHFRWKPDDELTRRPRFATPHMPRLDWQLWFAAMGRVGDSPWTINLMRRILEGSPPVLSLFRDNPFPNAPPKYVRAKLYQYHFTTGDEREQTGAWWKREELPDFCPPVSLDDLRVAGGY